MKKLKFEIEKCEIKLNNLLSQKHRVLLQIFDFSTKSHIKFPKEIKQVIPNFLQKSNKNDKTSEQIIIPNLLMKTSQQLIYYLEANKKIKNNEIFIILKKDLLDIDEKYNSILIEYNVKVTIYNQTLECLFYKLAVLILNIQPYKNRNI